MIRRHQLVLLVDECALPFAAHDDTVFCPFKMRQHHFTASLLRNLYSRLTAIRNRGGLGLTNCQPVLPCWVLAVVMFGTSTSIDWVSSLHSCINKRVGDKRKGRILSSSSTYKYHQ